MKSIGRSEVEKLSDRNLQRAIIELTDELVFVHGYSSEDAAIFVRSCYLYISELKKRNPKEPIKIARSEKEWEEIAERYFTRDETLSNINLREMMKKCERDNERVNHIDTVKEDKDEQIKRYCKWRRRAYI